jgi:agmatine deiminase
MPAMASKIQQDAQRPPVPAEWAPQSVLWTAWPSHGDLWLENLAPAREEVATMIKAISAGQIVKVLAMGDEAIQSAKTMLGSAAEVIPARFGDIWLRDTGPIFSFRDGKRVALRFQNNGWGGKYDLPYDDTVGDEVVTASGAVRIGHDFILEGGALEHDGDGRILTTRQCLLNPNRNPGWTRQDADAALKEAFAAREILWLDDGLMNDHTDGHIDNIARFVAPGKIVTQHASGPDDPNAALYEKTQRDLKAMGLEVITIPSPGRIENEDGDVIPASHMNFIIANACVAVPTYGTQSSDEAVTALAKLFPGRKVIGISSIALLSGGGSFHCITQQEPQS